MGSLLPSGTEFALSQQGKTEEPEDKDFRLKLQDQLNELKSLKVFRMAKVHVEGEEHEPVGWEQTSLQQRKLKDALSNMSS